MVIMAKQPSLNFITSHVIAKDFFQILHYWFELYDSNLKQAKKYPINYKANIENKTKSESIRLSSVNKRTELKELSQC